jgi:hypothetical protein
LWRAFQQLLMGAQDRAGAVEDEDPLGAPGRADPVRNHQK